MQSVLLALLLLIPLILALTVHEWAHAATAYYLGDDTAERAGRMTLNPIPHADPFGTLLLPFLTIFLSGASGLTGLPLLGWAKPTPVDVSRLTKKLSPRRAEMLVAVSGIAANLALATMAVGGLSVWQKLRPGALPDEAVVTLVVQLLVINVGLAVFNLLPFAPLDGEKVATGLLPGPLAYRYHQFSQRAGGWVLLAVILFGRPYLVVPVRLIADALWRVVGL